MTRIILIILSISILMSCRRNQESFNRDITIPVSVLEISPKSIENYVSITGTVKPIKEVQFKSEMAGNYNLLKNPTTGRLYMLSDNVMEGQEIILLQDEEYENNIRMSSLKISLETTKQVYDKQKSLFEKGGVTQSDVKNAEVSYINAKYAYDDAVLRLQKMRVKAPFSGTIVNLPYYTAGTKVASGSLMIGIMDYSRLYMDVNLAEKNMEFVKPNQRVLVTNYSLTNDTLKGTVTQLSPAIDPDTRSFKGSVEINNPNLKLRPGMYVKAEIVVASANNSIVIPKNIVISKQGGNYVFIVEKGIAHERKVQFGLENNNEVLILSGLKLKDHVVSAGFETLRDGSKVNIVK